MIVRVTYDWTDEKGRCYDCGSPAAFCLPDAYWNREQRPDGLTIPDDLGAENLRCAVCAANAAAYDGERVVGLFPDDRDRASDEELSIADHYPLQDGRVAA